MEVTFAPGGMMFDDDGVAIPRAFGITAKEATKALAAFGAAMNGAAGAVKDMAQDHKDWEPLDTGSLRKGFEGTSKTLTFTSGTATGDIIYGGNYLVPIGVFPFQTAAQKNTGHPDYLPIPDKSEARRWLDERVEEVRGLAWQT